MRRTFILVFLFAFCGTDAAQEDDRETTNVCVTLSIPDDEMSLLRGISKSLSQFLDTNLEKGHQSLNKVLSGFSATKSLPVKVDLNDPLESFLLQYQIAMHLEISKTLQEIKTFLQPAPDMVKSSVKTYTISSHVQLSENKSFYRPTDVTLRPSDCSELLIAGHTESGIYDIYPFSCKCTEPVQVLCDMETDGGGWTIFLLRNNVSKSINFTQNWENYKKGFGSPNQEYWLGNEHLHSLTFSRNYVLRLEAKDGFGREIWGEWNQFSVGPEENMYKLLVTKYNEISTATDTFAYFNAMSFSTFDSNNDNSSRHCAKGFKGGWWYNDCYTSNPTGIQRLLDSEGIKFNSWSINDNTARYPTWLQLKIRPSVCSKHISTAKLNTHKCV